MKYRKDGPLTEQEKANVNNYLPEIWAVENINVEYKKGKTLPVTNSQTNHFNQGGQVVSVLGCDPTELEELRNSVPRNNRVLGAIWYAKAKAFGCSHRESLYFMIKHS